VHQDCVHPRHMTKRTCSATEPGAADLKLLAALEGGLEPEREPEGPTMMGREARELMLSGQGDKALQLFKVSGIPHRIIPSCILALLRLRSWSKTRLVAPCLHGSMGSSTGLTVAGCDAVPGQAIHIAPRLQMSCIMHMPIAGWHLIIQLVARRLPFPCICWSTLLLLLLTASAYRPQEKYYGEKLELRRDDAAARRAVAAEYVRGLRWVLEYYYRHVSNPNQFEELHSSYGQCDLNLQSKTNRSYFCCVY